VTGLLNLEVASVQVNWQFNIGRLVGGSQIEFMAVCRLAGHCPRYAYQRMRQDSSVGCSARERLTRVVSWLECRYERWDIRQLAGLIR
jgi:hypothetical protein